MFCFIILYDFINSSWNLNVECLIFFSMHAVSKYNMDLKWTKPEMPFVWSIYMLPTEMNHVQKHCTHIRDLLCVWTFYRQFWAPQPFT